MTTKLKQQNLALKKEIRRLKQLVYIDFLTKIYNRRAFEEMLKNACKEISWESENKNKRKISSAFTLLLIDIDDFKKYNDKHGHFKGDLVLKKLAKLLKENVRSTDVVARWGGEEFVVILRGTTLLNAKTKAELIFKQIQKQLPVTVSIGIVQVNSKITPHQVFRKVDRALYKAKKLGKDQIVLV